MEVKAHVHTLARANPDVGWRPGKQAPRQHASIGQAVEQQRQQCSTGTSLDCRQADWLAGAECCCTSLLLPTCSPCKELLLQLNRAACARSLLRLWLLLLRCCHRCRCFWRACCFAGSCSCSRSRSSVDRLGRNGLGLGGTALGRASSAQLSHEGGNCIKDHLQRGMQSATGSSWAGRQAASCIRSAKGSKSTWHFKSRH
jgi:hypothetical protein